ncbi:hypothetical protein GBF38_011540 [Nibea albiflora]|uniref:Uncharacterized protein n=1 Tax=Nibea albiflora TaxID=240163 RepID=A0ACB7F3L3_NIBAL|nr:hypothetical protein GBF38_011540 [Nibea albiflora]
MNTCSTARPAHANGSYANHVSLRAQNRHCDNRQGPGHVTTHRQEARVRPLSTVHTPSVAPHSHQRRWSVDDDKCGTSPVIIVKKNKKEPQPPHRRASLHRSNSTSDTSFKRYSCPAMGVFSSPRHSSSSSSCSTCSCSSPPPVPTFVITGHDPLGWKLRPKSSSSSPRARANRLSLQIPLPVIAPDPKSSPVPNSQSDNTPNPEPSPRTKPPLRPKPPRRRHSDSSAFLTSLASPQPVVTREDLCATRLHRVTLSDEVFSGGNEEKVKVNTRPRKTPPAVPEKTFMARQIAQLIAYSRQHCKTNDEQHIYASVMKPKPKHETDDHRRLH